MVANNNIDPNRREEEKIAKGVVGGAIYLGAFITCCIMFNWKLAMVITLMLWGNNLVYSKD